MTRIEELVIAEAVQINDQWAFEGKNTLEWLAWAEGMRQIPGRRNDADEGYIISGRLQAMENKETDPTHDCPACGTLHDGYTLHCRDAAAGCRHCPEENE